MLICATPKIVFSRTLDSVPGVTEAVPLDLIETRTFGSRVIYERYGRAPDQSD